MKSQFFPYQLEIVSLQDITKIKFADLIQFQILNNLPFVLEVINCNSQNIKGKYSCNELLSIGGMEDLTLLDPLV